MRETQESISVWATQTFGPVGSNLRVAARANEEVAELLRALSADHDSPMAAEEAADVLIVLCRLASRVGHTIECRAGSGYASATNVSIAAAAGEQTARLIQDLAHPETEDLAGYWIRKIVWTLHALALRMGFDLWAEVEKKMEVNRARVWNLDGTGHGYHVRDKATA